MTNRPPESTVSPRPAAQRPRLGKPHTTPSLCTLAPPASITLASPRQARETRPRWCAPTPRTPPPPPNSPSQLKIHRYSPRRRVRQNLRHEIRRYFRNSPSRINPPARVRSLTPPMPASNETPTSSLASSPNVNPASITAPAAAHRPNPTNAANRPFSHQRSPSYASCAIPAPNVAPQPRVAA